MSIVNNVGNILATDLAAAFVHNMNGFLSVPAEEIENMTGGELEELIQDIYTQKAWITCLVDESKYSWHPWFNHYATPLHPPIFKSLHESFSNQHSFFSLDQKFETAIIQGNCDDAEILYHAGADDMVPNGGKLMLRIAVDCGHTNIVRFLVEQNIANNADINAKDYKGNTVLMLAAEKGYLKIVQFLVEHNADLNAKSSCGKTALIGATLSGHFKIAQYLKEHRKPHNNQCIIL